MESFSRWKYKIISIAALFGATLSSSSCSCSYHVPISSISISPSSNSSEAQYIKQDINVSTIRVGMTSKILGNVTRNKPLESNEGLTRYPTYGTSLQNITDEEKDAILSEDSFLRASSSTYDSMDKDGNLYLNGEKLNRKLYKHTASKSLFNGEVSDKERAVIKDISIKVRPRGNYITGLYAPAGEVVKIELSEEDLERTGGVSISIGQCSQTNKINNIWKERNDFCRMPNICNIMDVASKEAYVGSYLGGPIYVTPKKNVDFSIKISGAVEYAHYIYGVTSEEDFARTKNSTAPYFDFEVWDSCVRHSGPKSYANLDYENLGKMARFWYKCSNISSQIPHGSNTDIGITFLYDPFIAAGAAVAFVGGNWCNLPLSWMKESLNYDTFTTSGMWGTIHEYDHHFQRYGISPGDEVTNNAISLLNYISYTNISSVRSDKADWWNKFLDPYFSLSETNKASEGGEAFSSLSCYSDIIHAFGVDTFIKACSYEGGSAGLNNWYKALCEVTGYQFKYYFKNVLHQDVDESLLEAYSSKTEFIPAAMKYQTGRKIGETLNLSVKPYTIPKGGKVTIDFSKDLILPKGFTYKVKSISNPLNGTLTKEDDGTYTYQSGSLDLSGEMNVILEVEGNNIPKQEVNLTMNFRQDYEGIDATLYKYSSNIYSSAKAALEADFAGYDSKEEKTINKHNTNGISYNQIYTYNGKLLIEEDGEYKFSVCTSSRSNTYIEYGLNTNNYTDSLESSKDNPINPNEKYITYNCKKGDYVYFRLTNQSFHNDAYSDVYYSFKGSVMGDYSNNLLFNTNAKAKESYEEVEDKYPRVFNIDNVSCDYSKQKVVSYTDSYSSWDDNYKINNILDGDSSTSYHSVKDKMISSEPFELTIDLGKEQSVNTLNLVGYNGNQSHIPTTFKLYGGTSLDNLVELGNYENLEKNGRNISVSFDTTRIRYYKIVVTDTYEHRYVALSDINMSLNIDGEYVSPNEATYYSKGNDSFNVVSSLSTFGQVVKGKGKIEYSFDGDTFGLITSNDSEVTLRITIDGVVKDVTLSEDKSSLEYFVKLTDKEHKVTIEVLSGELILESFVK